MTHGSLICASKFKSVHNRPAVVCYQEHWNILFASIQVACIHSCQTFGAGVGWGAITDIQHYCMFIVCLCLCVGGGWNKGGKQQSWLMHSDDRHSLFLLRTWMLPVSCSNAQNANVFSRCSFAGRFICCKVGILTLSARLPPSCLLPLRCRFRQREIYLTVTC